MPDDKINKSIAIKAIKHDLLLLKHIPDKIIDKDIVELAISHEYDKTLKELNWIFEESNKNEYITKVKSSKTGGEFDASIRRRSNCLTVDGIDGNICLMRTDINPEYNTVITTNKISLYETSGSVTFQILSEKHKSIEFGDNLSIGLCIDRRKNELLYYWRSDG